MKLFEKDISILDRKFIELYMADRAYHNLEHAGDVFEAAKEIYSFSNLNVTFPPELIERIFRQFAAFHDVSYVPGSFINEKNSAHIWEQSTTYAQYATPLVSLAILATSDHFNPNHDSAHPLVQVMLDADLYQLAADYEIFELNSERIAEEFKHVYTTEQIKRGRLAWLKDVLSKPKIFRVCTGLEEKAQLNIQTSIARLEAEINQWDENDTSGC